MSSVRERLVTLPFSKSTRSFANFRFLLIFRLPSKHLKQDVLGLLMRHKPINNTVLFVNENQVCFFFPLGLRILVTLRYRSFVHSPKLLCTSHSCRTPRPTQP